MAATAKLLQQSILDGGIRSVNFFNGRLLTGEDLSREQQARRDADSRLGLAIGDGVAWGLEVTPAPDQSKGPLVHIEAGLALNRKGQSLFLANAVDIVLSDRAAPQAEMIASFKDCRLLGGVYAAKPGIYLLTIAPDSADEGKAPTHALDGGGRCTTDATVEAVQFRLLALTPEIDNAARLDADRMQSAVAWQCFDLDTLANFLIDPLRMPSESIDPLLGLAGKACTPCDVPLAVIRISTRIEFIDLWSVRRRPTPRGGAGAWSYGAEDRRRAEGEAMFLQFQAQLAAMTATVGHAGNLVARDKFVLLPAAGLLPMPGNLKDDSAAIATFFQGCTVRGPAFIEGARLDPLLRASYSYPPIDPRSGELIWLYWVRENRQAIDVKITPTPRACLVFSSGHMPYQADARLDVARWDYANYALDN